MHRKGINYDTGITPFGNHLSRESFDPGQVRREMEIIMRDLHCTAVRISGRDPHRIALAAEYALREGLEVWFAPFPCNLTADELMLSFVESAHVAETVRRQFPHVVFVRKDEWNGRCVFRPRGKCYDTAMNVFVVLSMISCHDSNVESPLCKERVSFDWRRVLPTLKETVTSTR